MRVAPGFVYTNWPSYIHISELSSFDNGVSTVRFLPVDGVLKWVAACSTQFRYDYKEWEWVKPAITWRLW